MEDKEQEPSPEALPKAEPVKTVQTGQQPLLQPNQGLEGKIFKGSRDDLNEPSITLIKPTQMEPRNLMEAADDPTDEDPS
jgi:hypothetical protein